MAGTTLAMRSMVSPSIMQLSSVSRRSISTSQALRAKSLRSAQSVSRIARRGYADAAPTPTPTPKPKKRFRALRWAWRLTWLSGLGLTGALAYSIYELRHPEEQIEPDPSKKTLVVLGMMRPRINSIKPTRLLIFPAPCRNWLGFRLPAQEARH